MVESILEKLTTLVESQSKDSQFVAKSLDNLAQAILADKSAKPDNEVVEQFAAIMAQKAQEMVSTVSTTPKNELSSGQNEAAIMAQKAVIYTSELIREAGKDYTRKTHPLLFSVVDYLENHEAARLESVRKIAELVTIHTGQSVGKSWAAIAKNYWQSQVVEKD